MPDFNYFTTESFGDFVYSGGDVTTMPIIGNAKTKAIDENNPGNHPVVEIIKDPQGNNVYVLNTWNNADKKIPELIHSFLTTEYVPA
jgi:DNA-binding beta-propeller fold protein YncE